MARDEEIVHVGHSVKITRPAKVLFPADGITKGDLVNYYRQIAPWMLPHIRDRAITLERYPDGIDKTRIIQKAVPSYYPEWIKTVTVKKAGGTVTHVVCNDLATLVYLANQACITPHIWLSRIQRLHDPDQMVFDLDPSGEDFDQVKATAQSFRKLLDELGLPAYVKTTGSRGLHLAVPLKGEEDFDSVRAFARALAEIVLREDPQHRTMEMRKDQRGRRIFLDIHRNAYAQTVAPAYAVRARPAGPVSVPLEWSELSQEGLRPNGVTIRTVFARLEKFGDPWKHFYHRSASLKAARKKLEAMHAAGPIPKEAKV